MQQLKIYHRRNERLNKDQPILKWMRKKGFKGEIAKAEFTTCSAPREI